MQETEFLFVEHHSRDGLHRRGRGFRLRGKRGIQSYVGVFSIPSGPSVRVRGSSSPCGRVWSTNHFDWYRCAVIIRCVDALPWPFCQTFYRFSADRSSSPPPRHLLRLSWHAPVAGSFPPSSMRGVSIPKASASQSPAFGLLKQGVWKFGTQIELPMSSALTPCAFSFLEHAANASIPINLPLRRLLLRSHSRRQGAFYGCLSCTEVIDEGEDPLAGGK
ncbi:hypothetical protein R3P38DRAFT_3353937 [Favolaschia claudopus]|uniref:Uncharacterized protein n=1 Tax=Favolaschia claudopus TaxID=2862362 RepID=A0AAW0BU23_9AGAR